MHGLAGGRAACRPRGRPGCGGGPTGGPWSSSSTSSNSATAGAIAASRSASLSRSGRARSTSSSRRGRRCAAARRPRSRPTRELLEGGLLQFVGGAHAAMAWCRWAWDRAYLTDRSDPARSVRVRECSPSHPGCQGGRDRLAPHDGVADAQVPLQYGGPELDLQRGRRAPRDQGGAARLEAGAHVGLVGGRSPSPSAPSPNERSDANWPSSPNRHPLAQDPVARGGVSAPVPRGA